MTGGDDDDFDLFGAKRSEKDDLSSLLDDMRTTAPAEHTPTAPAPTVQSIVEAERRAAPPGSRPIELARSSLEVFGAPGTTPVSKMRYAYRAYAVGTKTRERAALLARDLRAAERAVEEANSALGRAIDDAGEAHFPASVIAEVNAAKQALDDVARSREQIRKDAARQSSLASARRESAAAGLDPVADEANRKLLALELAEKRLDLTLGAIAVAEAKRDAAKAEGGEALRIAMVELESVHRDHAEALRATRDATLAYAEARRRAVLQMGRVAEADEAIEGVRVEERRAAMRLRSAEDAAMDALRQRYSRLGELAYDAQLGKDVAATAYLAVRRRREERTLLSMQIDELRHLTSSIDSVAVREGAVAWALAAAIVVAVAVLVAFVV